MDVEERKDLKGLRIVISAITPYNEPDFLVWFYVNGETHMGYIVSLKNHVNFEKKVLRQRKTNCSVRATVLSFNAERKMWHVDVDEKETKVSKKNNKQEQSPSLLQRWALVF